MLAMALTKKKFVVEARKRMQEKLHGIREQHNAISSFINSQYKKAEDAVGSLLEEQDRVRFMHSYPAVVCTLEECFKVLFLISTSIDDGDEDDSSGGEEGGGEPDKPPDLRESPPYRDGEGNDGHQARSLVVKQERSEASQDELCVGSVNTGIVAEGVSGNEGVLRGGDGVTAGEITQSVGGVKCEQVFEPVVVTPVDIEDGRAFVGSKMEEDKEIPTSCNTAVSVCVVVVDKLKSPSPGIATSPAPSNTTSPAPGNTTSPAPGNTTSPAPGNTSSPAPGNTTNPAPDNTASNTQNKQSMSQDSIISEQHQHPGTTTPTGEQPCIIPREAKPASTRKTRLKKPVRKSRRGFGSETSSTVSIPPHCAATPLLQQLSELGDYGNGPDLSRQELSAGCRLSVTPQIVTSPNYFWVQPLNPKVEDLQNWLSSEQGSVRADSVWSKLPGPPSLGMVVCACFSQDHEWYRARVIRVYKPGDKVEVLYVDFGNTETKSADELRPLHPKFASLPVQAFACSLSQVGPPSGEKWSRKHRADFSNFLLKTPIESGLYQANVTLLENCPLVFIDLSYTEATPTGPDQAVIGRPANVAEVMKSRFNASCVSNTAIKEDYFRMNSLRIANCSSLVVLSQLPLRAIHELQCPLMLSSREEDKQDDIHPAPPISPAPHAIPPVSTPVIPPTVHKVPYLPSPALQNIGHPSSLNALTCSSEQQGTARNQTLKSHGNVESESRSRKMIQPSVAPAAAATRLVKKSSNFTHQPRTDSMKKPDTASCTLTEPNTTKPNSQPNQSGEQIHSEGYAEAILDGMDEDGKLTFMMAHIESPSEFWVHVVKKGARESLDFLINELNQSYKYIEKPIMARFFQDHRVKVGDPCCTLFSGDNSFYRARILKVKREEEGHGNVGERPISKVKVQYVDFGNTEWVDPKKVHPLQERFLELPSQAVPCCLADVYPVRQEDEEAGSKSWCEAEKKAFAEMTGYEKTFEGVYVDIQASVDHLDVDGESLHHFPLIVSDASGEEEVIINEELVKLGLASSTSLGKVPLTEGPIPDVPCEWNPMLDDYESIRNSYAVDVDDPGVATMGYKAEDESKVCRWFQKGNCWRGEICPFKHISTAGTMTTDTKEVIGVDDTRHLVPLPPVETWVFVAVSAMYNPAHFYVVLPLGSAPITEATLKGPGFSIDEGYDSGVSTIADSIDTLNAALNEHYSKFVYNDKDMTVLAKGEIIVAKFSLDGAWYRARVVDADPDNTRVLVFFVDFGDSGWIDERDVHLIETKFMNLPFQAVECFLPVEPVGDRWTEQASTRFRQLASQYNVFAQIKSSVSTGQLSVDLVATSKSHEINIAQVLIKEGMAKAQTNTPFPRTPRRSPKGRGFRRSNSCSSSPSSNVYLPG